MKAGVIVYVLPLTPEELWQHDERHDLELDASVHGVTPPEPAVGLIVPKQRRPSCDAPR